MKKRFGLILTMSILALIFMFCDTNIGPEEEIIDESDTTAPSIPIGLIVNQDSSVEGTIRIEWEANIDDDFDKYRIYRADGEDALSLYTLVFETRLLAYTDVQMEYNTNYFYRISAVDKNTNESEKSTAVLATSVNINPPAMPAGFSVYAYNLPGETPTIELRWTENTESDFDHYNVYRHTTNQLTTTDSTYFIAQTETGSYIDMSVSVGTKYYYRITAIDKGLLPSTAVAAKYDTPLPQPSLEYPDHQSTTQTLRPTFGWERIENATKYEVVVQTSLYSGEYWRGEVDQPASGTVVEKGYPSTPALQSGTKYYWRIAVFSSDNTAANTYSDSTWYFYTPSSK